MLCLFRCPPFGEGIKRHNLKKKQESDFFLNKTKWTKYYHTQYKFRNYLICTTLGSEIILFLGHKQNFNCFF